MSSPPNTGSGAGATNPILQYYQNWSERNAIATRNLVVVVFASYLFSFFLSMEKFFGNIPFFTLFHFEVYRLLLSPFVGDSLISLIIIIMMFPAMGSRLESSMGSSAYIFLVGSMYLAVNVIFCAIALFFYLVGTPEALFWDCSGFWIIMFGVFTIDCLQFPDQPRRMMFIPVDLAAKYMPLVFYVLLSLFSGPQLSYALAIALGWLYMQGHLDKFKPSSYTLEEMEASGGLLHSLSRRRGYVLAGAALGHEAWLPVNAASATAANAPSSGSAPSNATSASSSLLTPMGGGGGGGGGRTASGGGVAAGGPDANVFAGAGHTTGSGGGGGSGWLSGGSAARLTPSEVAARRLAALQGGKTDVASSNA